MQQPVAADRRPPSKPAPRFAPEAADRRAQLAALLWLAGALFRAAPRPAAALTAIALGKGLLVPAQLWLTKQMVDALAARLTGGPGEGVLLYLAALAATLLTDRLLGGLEPYLQARVREEAGPHLHERVMQKAARLELAAFEHQGYYDRLSRAMSDAEQRGPQVLQHLLQMLSAAPMLLGYGVALATLTPGLLVIVAGVTVAAVVGWVMSGQTYWSVLGQKTRERRLADYYAEVLTDRSFAKEVRLYGLAPHLLARWRSLFWETRNQRRRLAMVQGLKQRGMMLISDGAIVVGLVLVVAAGSARATPGQYALLFQSIHGIMQQVFGLSASLQALGELSGWAADLRAFLGLPEEPGAWVPPAQPEAEAAQAVPHPEGPPAGAASAPSPAPPAATAPVAAARQRPAAPAFALHPFPRPLREAIRFEEVWFTYPGSDRPTLQGVTCEIGAREKVALVGENGAGKSTFIKLLLGLYQPDAGRITVDGRDVREIDPRSLRQAVSAVLQQFVRYQLTFGENVALGQPERMGDHPRLEEAVRRAGADEVLRRLAQGYVTLLGPDVGGVDLSGGQWQRVAIARGFFREAQVLVLDEPTAALDPLAELAVFERFAAMTEGRTAVLISHRLGMARLADRVLVLSGGRLVESGTHEALLQAGGEYARLFEAQARWYA